MPYIAHDSRERLAPDCDWAKTPGELNYQITALISNYWLIGGNYQAINDIIGALEGAKLEFYRRIAVPYEDTKIAANGDVY